MEHPFLLHLETATAVCSVAVSRGAELLALREAEAPFQHASAINGLIADAFQEAGIGFSQLEAVALSSGPGSYTALRVGASTAKGIAYARNVPLIAVPTLYSLAWAMRQEAKPGTEQVLAPMIDARRQDVYTQVFDHRLSAFGPVRMITLGPDFIAPLLDREVLLAGSGAEKAHHLFPDHTRILPIAHSAKWLPAPAFEAWKERKFKDIAYFTPTYITAPNITRPKKSL